MQKSNEWRAKHKTLWTWPVIGATWRILDYSMSAGDMKVFFIAVSQSKADKPHLRINHRFLCLQTVTTEELKADAVTQSGRKKKAMSRCPAWNQPCETEGHVAISASLLVFFCEFWQLSILTVVSSVRRVRRDLRITLEGELIRLSSCLSTQVEEILDLKPCD